MDFPGTLTIPRITDESAPCARGLPKTHTHTIYTSTDMDNAPVTKRTMLRRIEKEHGDRLPRLADEVRAELRADPHIYKVRIHLDGFVPNSYKWPAPGKLRIWTKDDDGKWRETRGDYDRKASYGRGDDVDIWTRRRSLKTRTLASYLSPQLGTEDRKLMREAVRAKPRRRLRFQDGWGHVYECRPRSKDRWESHADDWWVYPVSPDPKRDQDVVTFVAKTRLIARVDTAGMLEECAPVLSEKDMAELRLYSRNGARVRIRRPDGTCRDYFRDGTAGPWAVFDGPTPNPEGVGPFVAGPRIYSRAARPRERGQVQVEGKGKSGGGAGGPQIAFIFTGDSAEKAAAQRVVKQVLGSGLNLKGQDRGTAGREL